MMKTFSFFVIAIFAVRLAHGEEQQTEGGPRVAAQMAIRDNEKKFYEMGQEQGTRAAFLHFLADDSIVFRPGPISGKEVWNKRPEGGISLKWKPKFVWVSRSADLGYSTGPAEWRKAKEDAKPFGYGQFITIWKKQKDGQWRVELDVGGEVPGAPNESEEEAATEFTPVDDSVTAQPDCANAKKNLHEAEDKFATAAKADSTIALSEASLPTVRVHREGVFPAVGKYPAQLMLSVHRGHLSMEKMGGEMSTACDLAYNYGKYSLVEPTGTERGHYLQIWRTDADGTWKIALDFQTPLPNEQKK
ncbi:MAG: nuclear transport factor 2 family protein [Verrucomicrobiota bacterium]|nr:nuclear transport factor 2 family protein [Verrucomicrobiota bacterium]